MKKNILHILFIIIAIYLAGLVVSCDTLTGPSGDCPNGRSGAVCKDGTTSSATGSGACSGHGGVDRWICK